LKKIVLVEDEVYMREELTALLKKSAYQVEAIDVFDNTTEHILQSVPNLVLLDLNLPGISGFQICQEIKRKSSIPVLVLTSRNQMKDELHALELGAD
jgi:DNA-binding response OmpR family regulator